MKLSDYTNILIIKPGAIGDLLQLTPTIRALAGKYPGAHITLMVSSPVTAALFSHNPFVHETIVFDKRGEHRSMAALFRLRRRLREGCFDLVINFQRSNLKAWFLASTAFPCRLLVYHKARGRTVHAVRNHLETIAPLGIATDDQRLELAPGPEAEAFAERFWGDNELHGKPVVALNPGASNRIKCWPPARFAELGDRLAAELGVRIMVIGGPEERDLAEGIRAGMRHPVVDLIGKVSLLELGALLERCALLVSGDTGPLHLATAVGTPVVALFGAIDPERTGPVGKGHRVIRHGEISCVPCNAGECKNTRLLECMERITADEVFYAVAATIGERKGGPCGY
jgi:heptosyltransferase II